MNEEWSADFGRLTEDERDILFALKRKDELIKYIEEERLKISERVIELNGKITQSDLLCVLIYARRYLEQSQPTENVKLMLEKIANGIY